MITTYNVGLDRKFLTAEVVSSCRFVELETIGAPCVSESSSMQPSLYLATHQQCCGTLPLVKVAPSSIIVLPNCIMDGKVGTLYTCTR